MYTNSEVVILINYEYIETESKEEKPEGAGWEYWSMRKTTDEEKAVWRRGADEYK